MERVNDAHGFRWYKQGDLYLPSVTSILSVYPKGKQFERWLGESDSYEEAINKRDAAGERGSAVHDAIAQLVATGTVKLPEGTDPKVCKLITGFINWWREAKPEVMDSECFVHTDDYAGTSDLFCAIGDEPWCIDVKTSSGVYPSYHLQTAGYTNAYDGDKASQYRRGILWLKTSTKKGWQMVEPPHDYFADLEAFYACLTLFQHEYGAQPEFAAEKAEVPTEFRLED